MEENIVAYLPSLCMARETVLAALISLETCSNHPDDSILPNQLELWVRLGSPHAVSGVCTCVRICVWGRRG